MRVGNIVDYISIVPISVVNRHDNVLLYRAVRETVMKNTPSQILWIHLQQKTYILIGTHTLGGDEI